MRRRLDADSVSMRWCAPGRHQVSLQECTDDNGITNASCLGCLACMLVNFVNVISPCDQEGEVDDPSIVLLQGPGDIKKHMAGTWFINGASLIYVDFSSIIPS
ncbi:hypothetical protein BDN71DRAFT_1511069 [Pleurotus eryngii]|uniref:Uncharacterized protein n=1 Tax=Pleurotus eryngii TaxID=5323 RepID=A0A9P6DBF7_PLEER|nr:hypothetical protein BDN71DRAFT_1511069 [Pleurotus eryngii]